MVLVSISTLCAIRDAYKELPGSNLTGLQGIDPELSRENSFLCSAVRCMTCVVLLPPIPRP